MSLTDAKSKSALGHVTYLEPVFQITAFETKSFK